MLGRLMNLLGGKDTASAFQKIFHPLPNHHRVHFELLRNLVDRDRTTDGFQSHLGLEIGTVNLAFPTFCHATVLQNSSLNPCLKFGVHFSSCGCAMPTTSIEIDQGYSLGSNAVAFKLVVARVRINMMVRTNCA